MVKTEETRPEDGLPAIQIRAHSDKGSLVFSLYPAFGYTDKIQCYTSLDPSV